jgi:recombinational DNA repair protein (RecF pathway)
MIDACDRCHAADTPRGGHIVEEGCICRPCFDELYAQDECPRCHQTRARRHESMQCVVCHHIDSLPQGDPVRLFEPAPTQIAGQLAF